jgi:hypothetical protein
LKPKQGFVAVLSNTFKTWKMESQKWDPHLQSFMTSVETQAKFCCSFAQYEITDIRELQPGQPLRGPNEVPRPFMALGVAGVA